MSDFNDQYGEPKHMLHRADDMQASVDAAHRVDDGKWEEAVHSRIVASGLHGANMYELMDFYGEKNKTSISPRFAPLTRKELIFYCGKRRDGCSVWMDGALREQWEFIASEEELENMAKKGPESQQAQRITELEAKLEALTKAAQAVVGARYSGGARELDALAEALQGGE